MTYLHKIFHSELSWRRFLESSLEIFFFPVKITSNTVREDEELSCENEVEEKKKKNLYESKIRTIDHCLDKDPLWLWVEKEKSVTFRLKKVKPHHTSCFKIKPELFKLKISWPHFLFLLNIWASQKCFTQRTGCHLWASGMF